MHVKCVSLFHTELTGEGDQLPQPGPSEGKQSLRKRGLDKVIAQYLESPVYIGTRLKLTLVYYPYSTGRTIVLVGLPHSN